MVPNPILDPIPIPIPALYLITSAFEPKPALGPLLSRSSVRSLFAIEKPAS